jgi:hypothetical protein
VNFNNFQANYRTEQKPTGLLHHAIIYLLGERKVLELALCVYYGNRQETRKRETSERQ